MDTRIGFGWDSHAFKPGVPLRIGGMTLEHPEGLAGHSDGDVLLHAITDALLGCIGEGDIGQHFPPTDERWRGAPSWKFLDHAASLVAAKGGAVVHCDVTIICERPKVGPHRDAMRANIARLAGLDSSRVAVKATTSERLGFTGRGEGIVAYATATVRLPWG